MGVIRALLALAVIVTHTGPLATGVTMISGTLAVEAFYVISGFYMALILSDRYAADVGGFYAARALRIFPIYWMVLAATMLLTGVNLVGLDATSAFFVSTANVILFGQDVLRYLQVDGNGALALDLGLNGAGQTYPSMPVPQAWTLAIELQFYLLAPLLVGLRLRWLAMIAIASLALREAALYLHWFGPWHYYALPFQLGFFVTGMLSHRIGRVLRASGGAHGILFGLIVCAEIFMGAYGRVGWLLFATFALCLPFIFEATKRSAVDAAIGQLSYPLYLCHIFVIQLIGTASPWPVVAVSIATAVVLLALNYPIERARERIARRSAAPRPQVAPT